MTAGDLGADGAKSITAQFTDLAGNSSTTPADVITLDTTAPVVAIGNPGGPTNQPSLSLSGTIAGADAGTTIAIFDGTTQVGAGTISGGTWSAGVTLGNGSNVLTAHVTDAAGNTSISGAVTYTLSTTAPTGGTPVLTAASDSGTSHTDDVTNVTAPTFTVALGSTVVAGDTVQLLLGGSALAHPVTHTVTAADISAGGVSLTVTAGDLGADGSKQIAAQFSDSFGNSSTTAALTITLDTTAPGGGTPVLTAASDSGTSHTDGITDVTAPTFTVALNPTVAAGDTVQLLLGGSPLAHPVTHTVTAADISAGSVSLTVTAGDLGADGAKSVTAQFTDLAGNSSTTPADVITLDTTAPVVAIGNPGGPTNQPSLSLTGTIAGADAGTTIAIFDGTTQVGAGTISGGTWSAGVTLGNGSNVLTAHVTDAAGNTSISGAVTYTLSTTAPTGGTPVLTAASDSGTSHTDDVTNVTAPTFTVALGSTVVAGDTVQLLLGGSALAHPVTHTVTAADISAGGVSLTVTAGDLGADGSKQIAAQFSDSFGNSSTTAALTITLDTTAPGGGTPVLTAASDSGTSHTDGITDVTAPTFTVALNPTVAAGDTVQLLLGGSPLAHPVTHTVTAADISAGSVSLTVTAGDLGADGAKSVTAQFTDLAGNSSTTPADVITLDTTAPVVAIGNPGGPTNQPSLSLSGTIAGADAGTTIAIFDGTTQVGAGTISGGTWSAGVTLGNGSNVLTAHVTDAAGNTSISGAVTYTLSTTAPTGGTPVLTAASNSGTSHTDDVTNVTAPTFTVALGSTVVAGDTVQLLLGGSALAHPVTHTVTAADISAGGVSLTVTAGDLGADGSKQIAAQFSDSFGNSSTTAALTITLDTTAPGGGTPVLTAASDSGTSHTDGITDVTAPTFTVALNPTVAAGDTVQLLLGGSPLAHPVTHTVTAADISAGSVSLTVTAGDLGADGAKSVTAQFTDLAGNSSTTPADVITLDTTAPVVAIGNPGGPTNQPIQTISGTVTATEAAVGATVFLYDNGGTSPIGTATVGSGGAWTTSVTLSGNGTHSIVAKDTDAAGNTGASAPVTFNLTITSGGWGSPAGGSWNSAANWSSGTVPGATTNVVFDPVGAAAPYVVTIPSGTLVTVNSITLNDPDITLLDEGTLTIAASLVETSGIFQIANGGTLSLGGGSSLVIDFAGTGGNLILGSSPGFTGAIDAVSTATGAVTISGIGAVTTGSGDAIHLQGAGGTLASPATLGVSLGGAITGAATGISVIQNGFGAVSIVTSGAVIGNAGDGIFAEDLNAADNSNLTVAANGNVSGSSFGIYALTESSGGLTVAAGANVNITGQAPAIQAVSAGVGNISVTTATGDVITSNSTGINANNQAAAIPLADASTISVTAYGTIDSGPILTSSGNQPAGILAGYRGGTTNTINPNVFGSVTINNNANITASGGDGIRGYNYGTGNITITDQPNTTIVAPGEYGIRESNYGSGNDSVTTSSGDSITSGSSGISAVNLATAIAAAANSQISVVAHGTINVGTGLTGSGSQTQGISAGYFGSNGTSNTAINGTVSVDSFANVTAAAGWGINAFNWGNGSVTLTDESGTTVSGAQYGIAAYSLSTGSGGVTVNVLSNATITAGALYGLSGIQANTNNASNVSVTTSTGDIINSGGTGINSNNSATSAPSTSAISITANGTINSGFDMNSGGGEPGGIWAGYNGGSNTVNTAIAGSVIVDSFAAINAEAGAGIGIYNDGVGNVSLTLETTSAISAPLQGVSAFAQGGGNVTIVNKGTVTSASGFGILVGTGTGLTAAGSGTVSVTNSGTVTTLGSSNIAAVQINNDSTKGATFTNTGSVVANLYSAGSSLSLAVSDNNGSIAANNGAITVNNSGTISGNVSLNTTSASTFQNQLGGIWNIRGQNFFNGVGTISNSGIINIAGVSGLDTGGTLGITNSGTINVAAIGAAYIGGAVTGTGTFNIGDRAELEFATSVAAGQTVSFFDGNGLLTLDDPSNFHGTIAGLAIGDAIDFNGIAVASAAVNGSVLTVTETNSQTLTYQIAGALAGNTFSVLSGNEIILVPASVVPLTGSSGPLSFAPSTQQLYILSNKTISGGSTAGFNVTSSDSTATDYLTVQINQASSISGLSGSSNGVNLTTTGANIALINAGTISSGTGASGKGINTNSTTGSTDIIDYGNVTGGQYGIDAHTSGVGALNIVVGGTAIITGTTSYGILAISTLGVLDVSTLPGITINSASSGILAENQGASVPQANNSSISVSTVGTINSGSTPNSSGNEPAGIVVGFLGGTTSTPTSAVAGNVNVSNSANINAAAGMGIDAFNYGVGDLSVSDSSGATIMATAAGATASGFAQYGIFAFNYEAGNTSVTTAFGSTINSGSSGINAANQATAISAAAASTVTVVALGAINSGSNLNNSGSTPAGILAGFNPGNASVFNAGVAGNVLVEDSGAIVAAAGDGVDAYNYGVGNVEVDLGFGASISALVASTSTGRKSPYGIGAFNYGSGDVTVTTTSGDVIQAGGAGINISNQATSIAPAAGSVITVSTAGTISSGTILNPSGSQPGGIQAGYLGGTTGGAANTSVNGTVIVNNAANITAAAGWGIDAYNYGNGDVTVNDAAGTTVTGVQYGIAGSAESGGTGNVAINIYSGATPTYINATANYGINAFSTDAGNISVITGSNDFINSAGEGIAATNEAAAIAASVDSSIVVTSYATINSGTAITGAGSPPGGIVAGYLGSTIILPTFPLTTLYGNVVVNNFGNITAAAGSGIRAYTYGIGNVTVNDDGGTITTRGASAVTGTTVDNVNGYDTGISVSNKGTGNIDVVTAAGITINSAGSGISAINQAPAPITSTISVPSTSEITVLASGTISSGSTPSASTPVIYTLNATGPSVTESLATDTGASATDGITSNDALTGLGLANTVVHFTIDGSLIAPTVTTNAQGAWSYTPTGLASGTHTIVASQTDALSNTGTASLTFTLDTTAPVVAITSAGGSVSQAAQTITGTVDVADAGAIVKILDGSITIGAATVQGNGTWSGNVVLANGSNSLTAQVVDATGNVGTSSAVIDTLSITGPSVIESLAFDTGVSATDNITANDIVTGSGLPNTVVHFTIDGSPVTTTVTANAQGAWSFTPAGLADGTHTIVASQTDALGNTGTASLTFTFDTTAPVVAITGLGAPTGQAAQTISGTADVADAGATVYILDGLATVGAILQGTTTVGTATVQSDGTWSTSIKLGNGLNVLRAEVIDAAGNIGISGDPAAGILAGYNPDNSDIVDSNVSGNVYIDDHASIAAAAGTDGIRGINYGTGAVTIITEIGADISGGRYGIAAFAYDGGNASVTNHGYVTGSTAAIDALSTSTGTVFIDNYGAIAGDVVSSGNATFHNEAGAIWNLAGSSTFTGTSALINDGAIDTTGVSGIATSGVLSLANTGVVEVQSGSLDVAAGVTGLGSFTIDSGGLLEFAASVSAGSIITFQGTAATLKLDDVAHFAGSVTGFTFGDTIDLVGISPANVSVGNSGPLQIAYGTGSIALGGNYNPADFTVGADGHGGTDVTWNHQAPVISTSGLTVTQNGNGTTTIAGLQVSDSDAAASSETFTITATTGAASSGTSVSPSTGSGVLTAINSELGTGITYNPGATPPSTDKVALTVSDGFGATDTVNFVFNLASSPTTPVTLAGTSGKDVIFATGNNDTLTGGGGADQFVFNKTTGAHAVTDFSTINDHIDLTALSSIVTAATLNAWLASNVAPSTTNPADTVISLGSTETITLHNVLATSIHASDFIVHA